MGIVELLEQLKPTEKDQVIAYEELLIKVKELQKAISSLGLFTWRSVENEYGDSVDVAYLYTKNKAIHIGVDACWTIQSFLEKKL